MFDKLWNINVSDFNAPIQISNEKIKNILINHKKTLKKYLPKIFDIREFYGLVSTSYVISLDNGDLPRAYLFETSDSPYENQFPILDSIPENYAWTKMILNNAFSLADEEIKRNELKLSNKYQSMISNKSSELKLDNVLICNLDSVFGDELKRLLEKYGTKGGSIKFKFKNGIDVNIDIE